jgi:DNA-binding transcriptional regulator YhcF (GntR family)
MQRALAALEDSGMLYTHRTSGRFVTEDKELIRSERRRLAEEKIRLFTEEMKLLDFTKEEILGLLEG